MLRSLVAALALSTIAVASWAETTPTSPVAPVAQERPELKPGEELVKVRCKDEVATGTRFAKRKCRRLDDLARAEEDARATVNEINRHPYLPPGSN